MRISYWSSYVCSSDLQVIDGFAQASTIALNFAQRRLDLNDQIDSLGLCLLPEFSYPSLYECGQFDWLLVQWQSACLSLRQIQDVLDQAGKPDSAFHDGADIFARLQIGRSSCRERVLQYG